MYQSEIGLSTKLQMDESPGIVLYAQSNQKWIGGLKNKYREKYRWYCLEDENWIDEEGNLVHQTDVLRLINKINKYIQMFNTSVLDSCSDVEFYKIREDEEKKWNIYQQFVNKNQV